MDSSCELCITYSLAVRTTMYISLRWTWVSKLQRRIKGEKINAIFFLFADHLHTPLLKYNTDRR